MHHVLACLFCGGIDPTHDQLLLQAAIAGGITTPWMLRAKLRAFVDRLRGRDPAVESAASTCALTEDGPDEVADLR